MSGLLVTFVASFTGSATGIVAGGVLTWRYYMKPRMARAGKANRVAMAAAVRHPAPPSQVATATTPGFTPHERPVTVHRAGYGRERKAHSV